MVAGIEQRKRISNPRHNPVTEAPRSSGVTVSVGCKLPNGIHMDIRSPGETTKRVTLKGINSLTQGSVIRPAPRKGEFAITSNVPKDFFDEWMRLNKSHPAVVNDLIFVHKTEESVRDMGKDLVGVQHGFEPLDPSDKGNKQVSPFESQDGL